MDVSKKSLKLTTYILFISVFILSLFFIIDTYIFPDACGLMILVPIIILLYFLIIVSGILLLIMLFIKIINKTKNKK
jgi:hypothetical protein